MNPVLKTRLGFHHPPDLNVAFPDFFNGSLNVYDC